MSGPTCPDCGCQHLQDEGGIWNKHKVHCTICGWKGKVDPDLRMELTTHGYSKCDELSARREKGHLFYLRIYYRKEKAKDAATDILYDELGVSEWRIRPEGYLVAMMTERPSDAILARISSIKGIKDVTVF